jgi:excisionase family DNA binding protein
MSRLLTVREAAARLSVSVAWVNAHTANGKRRRRPILPSVKLGRSVRISPEDLEQFIATCKMRAEGK